MKKIGLFILVAILLTGCTSGRDKLHQEKLNKYESLYQSVLDNDDFASKSKHFDLRAKIEKESDGTYKYQVIIDNPRVAMYDISIIVVEDTKDIALNKEMMVTSGVFEDKVSMIPNQAREDAKYGNGISLVRDQTTNPEVNLKILVTWKSFNRIETYKEFVMIPLKYEEPKPEVVPEEPETTTEETPAEETVEETVEE